MSALGKVVRAGVGRKRVQTLVMVLTTMMAVTACVLAAGLLAAAQGPFDQAFVQQRGAHLNVLVDQAKATPTQLAATAHAPGVTALAGPYPALPLRPHVGENTSVLPVGGALPPVTLVARTLDEPLDGLRVTLGRWLAGPGEVVLPDGRSPLALGDRMTFPDLPGSPTLTVVGLAASVSWSADGWVAPAQAAALTAPGSTEQVQLLYRFAHAGTDTEVDADRAALAAALPPGALTGATSYLPAKRSADRTAETFVPFVVAFGLLGLAMSVLTIGVVVSGAVTAATRRIGILKSLGFTPAQVARAYVGQALVPASVGTALGVLGGNALAVPVLGLADKALRSGLLGIPLWVDLVVPALALAAVAGTALVPALRAGRLRTVEALAVGRTAPGTRPGASRTVAATQRLLARMPVPRALSLGLAGPLTRPVRTATTTAAVLLGTVGVTLGVGLAVSMNGIQDGLNADHAGAVVAAPPMDRPAEGVDRLDEAAVAAAITARPGTGAWFSTVLAPVTVADHTGRADVVAYGGDSSRSGYRMISGRWFHGGGEAVVGSGFLATNQVRVGDTITLTDNGRRSAPVRIVGEALSTTDVLLTDRSTLTPLGTSVLPASIRFHIDLVPGVDRQAYADALGDALRPLGLEAEPGGTQLNITVLAMNSLAAVLTLLLVAVAGLGVLNTVLLDTRERVHDLGVLKALGMLPRQTVGMVLTSVCGSGLLAGLVGVPSGVALHHWIVPAMARAAGTGVPEADLAVFEPRVVLPLILGGLVMALLGALPPATWAARTRTVAALRTE
ncbi:ABC transporter permease [Streptomyces sp. CB01881]|uniref:ABC transporter permease n=1 Tax=Streptomyces sp. CB01881 TaxID=2078691 RepID=UPI000CDBBEAE|nr:ABC transporter permease [Streptomyces sp. CB01881]AUY52387.1 ABC transporter permease [Streptomyces sp. CB01881]TYC71812.1 ABC transporter permease [Streptomyces sp. CB01881]